MPHVPRPDGPEQGSPRRIQRERQHRERLLRDLGRLALNAGEVRSATDSRTGRDLETDPVASAESELLRQRVANELHDGVLQVLTAIAVRLDAADMMMGSRPDDARELINEICKTVRAEQRELRMFVDELKGPKHASVGGRIPMDARVDAMLDRVEAMWRVSCDLTCRGELPGEMEVGRTVLRLVQEATVNAIRHGNATRIEVRLRSAGDRIRLIVSDNGSGFEYGEDLDHDVLVASRLGPVLLERRVVEAGGRLRILTSEAGTHIFMCLPLARTDRSAVDAASVH